MRKKEAEAKRGLAHVSNLQGAKATTGAQGFKPKKAKKVVLAPKAGVMTRMQKSLCVNDSKKLEELLLKTPASQALKSLFDLAFEASYPYREGYKYVPVTGAFCDGFEVKLGKVSKYRASAMKFTLQHHVQNAVQDFQIKNMVITERAGHTYIWFTIDPAGT